MYLRFDPDWLLGNCMIQYWSASTWLSNQPHEEMLWLGDGCICPCLQELDPIGKFATESDIWDWQAEQNGTVVPFASCCSSDGFAVGLCTCSPRKSCPLNNAHGRVNSLQGTSDALLFCCQRLLQHISHPKAISRRPSLASMDFISAQVKERSLLNWTLTLFTCYVGLADPVPSSQHGIFCDGSAVLDYIGVKVGLSSNMGIMVSFWMGLQLASLATLQMLHKYRQV